MKLFIVVIFFLQLCYINLYSQEAEKLNSERKEKPFKISQNTFGKKLFGSWAIHMLTSNNRKDLGGQFDVGYQLCPYFFIGSGISADVMEFTVFQGYTTAHFHLDKGTPLVPYFFGSYGFNMKVIFENENYKNPNGAKVYSVGIGVKKVIQERYAVNYYFGFKKTSVSYSYESYYQNEYQIKREIFRIIFGIGFQF